MSVVCIGGDGPVARETALHYLEAGHAVAVLCQEVSPYALLVHEYGDALLTIEVSLPGGPGLDDAREAILLAHGPIDALVLVPECAGVSDALDISDAIEVFADDLRFTSGAVTILEPDDLDDTSLLHYVRQLHETESAFTVSLG